MIQNQAVPETLSAETPLQDNSPGVLAMGIGGEGVKVINALKQLEYTSWMRTAVIDTDSAALKGSLADYKVNASADWSLRCSGCGGDVVRGERAVARERSNIAALLEGVSMLVVAGGLGGGTATGGLLTIASVARSCKVPAVFLVTMPFSFESYTRRMKAEECVKQNFPAMDILLPLPNDILFMQLPPSTPVEEAFEASAKELAHVMAGIADVMRCRSVIGSDYATFMAALQGRACSCSVGIGSAGEPDGLDRCTLAVERMLESPFLGGIKRLENADAVLFTLSGGTDLQISEMKRALELVSGILPEKANVILGTNTSPELSGRIQMTAVAINYESADIKAGTLENSRKRNPWEVPLQAAPSRSPEGGEPNGDTLEQGELPLQNFSRGIFEKYPPTRYRDCEGDLDVPTFQRKNLHSIDVGT